MHAEPDPREPLRHFGRASGWIHGRVCVCARVFYLCSGSLVCLFLCLGRPPAGFLVGERVWRFPISRTLFVQGGCFVLCFLDCEADGPMALIFFGLIQMGIWREFSL